MHILVTGAAGFIGAALSAQLCSKGHTVVGIDSLNDYYSVQLKKDRLARLDSSTGFSFSKMDMADDAAMDQLFSAHSFDYVVNLAAQAGVRYSLENPRVYIESNVHGFINILEGCRATKVKHLVYASSSSVYGLNTTTPFSVHAGADHPVSVYAATKKSNEMMAHSYSHLYGLPTTGLRFFTVYGPWGRPDMALYIFTKAIFSGEAIPVFNNGEMRRDFTYIDDIVEGVSRLLPVIPSASLEWDSSCPDPSLSPAPYALYNIGNNQTESLGRFIDVLESCIGIKAQRNYLPMQPGDVKETYANVDGLIKAVSFSPSTSIEKGVARFVEWYRAYHHV